MTKKTTEPKVRKPEPPKVPTLLKDFMEGKSSTQSLKLEAIDYEGIQAMAVKFPEFKAVSFKDIYRKAVVEATIVAPATGNPQLATEVEQLKSLNKQLASDLETANNFLSAAQAQYRNAFPEAFQQFKAQVEKAIPELAGLQLQDGRPFLLTNADFVSLLVDYAASDKAALPPLADGNANPDAQFPSYSACEPFIKRYTDVPVQTVQQEKETGDNNTTGAESNTTGKPGEGTGD